MKELWMLIKSFNLHCLFKSPTNNPFVQFFRYIFVGGIATVVDWGIFYFLQTTFPKTLYVSAAISFCSGLFVNYILSKLLVFTHCPIKSRLVEFLIYLVTGLVGLGLTEIILLMLIDGLNIHFMISKVTATVIVFIWNFGSKKILLYRKRRFK